jgi:hypothetical protein
MSMSVKNALALVVLAGATSAASADVVVSLGSGWEVIYSSTAPLAITPVSATPGQVTITKTVSFTDDLDLDLGQPQPWTVTFRQTAADANTASQIFIDAEFVTNLTGLNIVGYRQLLGLSRSATWDASSSAASVNPAFTTTTISGDSRELFTTGGPGFANGQTWTPGVASGGFLINVDLGRQNTPIVFTLKEFAIVPAPGAAALMGVGLVAMGRRRRAM